MHRGVGHSCRDGAFIEGWSIIEGWVMYRWVGAVGHVYKGKPSKDQGKLSCILDGEIQI